MPSSNLLGQRGEKAVETVLCRPTALQPAYPFKPIPLGEKAELFDLMVHLLDNNERLLGPHCFVQIKTTAKASGTTCQARFTAAEVANALRFKVPAYLIAVDASDQSSEKIFVMGIDSDRTKGISSVKCKHSLLDDAVRETIYKETKDFFSKVGFSFLSSLT